MSEITKYIIRNATKSDIPDLEDLIRLSAHGLSQDVYSKEQIDAALQGVFGVDTQLIRDQTYFVVELSGRMVGCGGWSYRATLFGNDDIADRNPRRLNPEIEAAKIRAFFVHPEYARQGIGRLLLAHCESEALRSGFMSCELGSTLPGVHLYESCGYIPGESVDYAMTDDLSLTIVPMSKKLL